MPPFLHIDMDAFFVSVEELFDPSLKGKPVVVGGQPNERGVVSAASYAARRFGVHSALPLRTAAKLCPHAIFLDGHRERYTEYSHKVHEVLLSFTPVVEMASIDEAYLDIGGTGRLYGPPLRAAHILHERVRAATGLNCSIGVANSRMLAKILSDQAKPNGIVWVMPGAEAAFLAPLDVRVIPGVGKVAEKQLHAIGVRKIGDVARLHPELLERHLGKLGQVLLAKAQGVDSGAWYDSPLGASKGPKSISHEHTFAVDTADREAIDATVAKLSEMVGRRLREHGLRARTIQLKLRYSDFTTITRARTLTSATDLDTEIHSAVRALFTLHAKPGAAVRLLGVHAAGWDTGSEQMELLDAPQSEKWRRTLAAVDRLRDRFGESAVSLAAGMRGGFRERVHENHSGPPGKGANPKVG